jgi:hypothetical protein
MILLTSLLAGALLPLQPEYQGVPVLDLLARSLRLMQWMILGCSAAGLTATLKVLGERWRNRPVA